MWPIVKRTLATPLVLLVGVVLLWFVGRAAISGLWIVGVAVLVAGTYWLIRPELRTLFRTSDDHRPWLVRLREHRWRPLALPGGYRVPRWAAYLAVAVAWRLLL